jgi:putative transposase
MIATRPDFERKNIRLPAENYIGQRLYFVTLCFERRQRFGASPRFASWLIAQLRHHADNCGFLVHAYCIMPDHVHLLAGGKSDDSNLIKFVEAFKQATSISFSRRTHRRLWQFKYYDHILRRRDSADAVAAYIWWNPVRQGLCRTTVDYSFLGSFTPVGKKMLESGRA